MPRRKSNSCLNCGATLDPVYNFCPLCGQENNSSNVSFGKLLKEFFVNYFSLDSRFSQTIKPFFLKPGLLTLHFNEGKRMSFMNPVRMYLIMSLFYFFVFTKAGQTNVRSDNNHVVRSEDKLGKIKGVPSSVQKKLNEALDSATINRVNSELEDPSLYNFYESLTQEEKEEVYPILLKGAIDSTKIYNPEKVTIAGNDNVSFSLNKNDDKDFILNRIDFGKLNAMADKNIADDIIYDSLKLDNVNSIEKLITKQIIRITKADKEILTGYVLQNVPIMMFLLLPLFALILKLLYVRRKVLYINHLVHAIHLHCFAYLIYGISLIFAVWILGEDSAAILSFVAFLIVTVYAWKSFRKVYSQGWFKTLLKFSVTGVLYLALVSVFFISELLISVLLF